SAVGFLLRSLIMFQTFISRHNSNFFSDKLVLTSVTPASSAPVLQRSEERRVGKECRARWGREHDKINSAMLGVKTSELRHHFDTILDFYDIERFTAPHATRSGRGLYVPA